MKRCDCSYCTKGELLSAFGYLAFETELSEVIVFKEQSKPGRMIVAYKPDHVAELKDLEPAVRNEFMQDVCDIAQCMENLYHPDRINYGGYGDVLGHLHIHLCPKYKDGDEWGGTFTMNNHKHDISEDECKVIAERFKEEYKKLKG